MIALRTLAFSAAAALLLALMCNAPTAYAQTVGKIGKSVPAAFRMPPAQSRLDAKALDPIVRNETLETGANGGLLVTFADGSELTLGENANAVVDEFVYSGPGTGSASMKLAKGAFRFISGAMREENVKINTGAVTIGIRGTEIFVVTFSNGASLIVTRKGLAEATTADGSIVRIPAGSSIAVSPDGRFSKLIPINTQRNADGEESDAIDAIFDPNAYGEGFLPLDELEAIQFVLLESDSPKRRIGGNDRYVMMGGKTGSKTDGELAFELAYFMWEKGYFPADNGAADVSQSRALGTLTRRTGAIGSTAGRNTRAARPVNRTFELPSGVIVQTATLSSGDWVVTVGDQAVNLQDGLSSYGPIVAPNGGPITALNTLPAGNSDTTPDNPNGNQIVMTRSFTLGPGQRVFTLSGLANFVTAEFPLFVGTGFNDDVRIRITTPNGDVFDLSQAQLFGASVNASTFTAVSGLPAPVGAGGQTGWKDFLQRVRASPGGTVLVEVRIRNVGDQIVHSTVLLNNVSGGGGR